MQRERPSDAEFQKDFADSVKLADRLTYTSEHAAKMIWANTLAYFRTRGVPPEVMEIALDQAKRDADPLLSLTAPAPEPSNRPPPQPKPQPWMNYVWQPFKFP